LSSTLPIPAAHPAISVHGGIRATQLFAAATLIISLFLQRFALPVGSQSVDLVGPLGLLLALYELHRGTLVLHRRRLILFALLALWAVVGAACQTLHPNAYGVPLDLNSLAQFLLLTGFATLSFARAVGEEPFLRGAADILAVVAGAGIIQFVLQFLGAGLFAFSGLLPERLLFESGYNVQIPAGIGDALKSNGFFLLEPSIFSQVMAMALIVEALAARRRWHLALFAIALVLSFSGTGWIVLGSFLLSVGARLGRRGLVVGASVTATILLLLACVLLIAPETASVFSDRFAEFSEPGTSANLRFATPLHLLRDVLAREGNAWLIGIGPGASERLDLAYDYNVNTPIKILLEYGLPAVVLYVALFLTAERTRLQSALVVPAIVLLLLTGGYQEFAPILFPISLLICVARLRPADGVRGQPSAGLSMHS
jgi:hypothetical protein